MCTDCDQTKSPNLRPAGANVIGGNTVRQLGDCLSDEEKLDHIFKSHPPNPSTGPKFETLREAARHFAKVILMNVPPSADRSAAIRKVREAVMTANAGVSLNGLNL